MKILGRTFIFPIRISFGKLTVLNGNYGWQFLINRMAGTTTTTTYHIQYRSSFNEFQLALCWRPSVTKHYWNKNNK